MKLADAIAYLEGVAHGCLPHYKQALAVVITAAQERDAAVADLERMLWIGGPCKYCAKDKGKGGHSKLDRPCGQPCEPKWRGLKERK